MPDPIPDDARRRRLLFRATHRGTHEADLLIGGFVSRQLTRFSQSELDALECLLELPDVDLADYLCRRVAVPLERETPILRAMIEAAGR